ncbi:hypothetical protein [Streptomyces roseifaciens]|uniref:hypothetical protein n=1 Tax=Streptomyces roseifaciens TaxID=1488406 RepID=UPI0007C7C36E|nr:hypothetical protein [Streptomyces roseifaciens]
MSHIVLAVGATAVTLAGSAWYLPAVADLRAGDDRPRSGRLAARACVTGWAALATVALLLFGPAPWQALCAVAGGGAVAGALLRSRARAHLARERRETEACWAALHPAPPAPGAGPSRRAFLTWSLLGTVTASALAVTLLLVADMVTAALTSGCVAAATLLAAGARVAALRGPRA